MCFGTYNLADGRILCLFVKVEPFGVLRRVAAAKVYLDEVKPQVVEQVVHVSLFVAVQPDAHASFVVVPVVPAGVAPGVGVGAGFQAEAVDVVDHGLESLRKSCGVGMQPAVGFAAVKGAVVNVDIFVPGLFQAVLCHGEGLFADKAVADVYAVGVP